MKRLLSILAVVIAAFSTMACKGKPVPPQKPHPKTIVRKHVPADTVKKEPDFELKTLKHKKEGKGFNVHLKFTYAVSKKYPLLANAINEQINEKFGGQYEGDPNKGEAMMAYYWKQLMHELANRGKDEDWDMIYENVFKKVYETNEFITFEYNSNSGVHASEEFGGITFRKYDGKILTKEYLNNEMDGELRKGLKRYYKVNTLEELRNILEGLSDDEWNWLSSQISDIGLTKEGMQVRINALADCTANNYPAPTIPYSRLKQCLTSIGKTFLPKKQATATKDPTQKK